MLHLDGIFHHCMMILGSEEGVRTANRVATFVNFLSSSFGVLASNYLDFGHVCVFTQQNENRIK